MLCLLSLLLTLFRGLGKFFRSGLSFLGKFFGCVSNLLEVRLAIRCLLGLLAGFLQGFLGLLGLNILSGGLLRLLTLGEFLSLLGQLAKLLGELFVLKLLSRFGNFLLGCLLGVLGYLRESFGRLFVSKAILMTGGPCDILGYVENFLADFLLLLLGLGQ